MRRSIYISGGITGVSDYMVIFRKAESHLKKRICNASLAYTSVVNPAKVNAMLPNDFEWDDYMNVCYKLIDLCDGIYMLKGWKDSKGASLEYHYARAKGLEIFYE